MIRSTSMAIAMLSLSLPVFANECELESTQENHQASKFELTVKNNAVEPLWVTTKGKQKPGVTISSRKSLTRTFQISKDLTPSPSVVKLSDFGINVGTGAETNIGQGNSRIWSLRFTVINALNAIDDKTAETMSS